MLRNLLGEIEDILPQSIIWLGQFLYSIYNGYHQLFEKTMESIDVYQT